MTLDDQAWKEHIAMLKASKLAAQGTLAAVSLLACRRCGKTPSMTSNGGMWYATCEHPACDTTIHAETLDELVKWWNIIQNSTAAG
jgi:hypothetical protein